MRIAYLSTDFGVAINGSSGSSVHVREVVRALQGLGHDVRVFSTSRYEFDHSTDSGSVEITHLEGFSADAATAIEHEDLGEHEHVRREFRRILYSEYLPRALQATFASFDPHFIYERYSLFGYAGVRLASDLNIPLVLEVNAPLSSEASKHRDLVLKRTAAELEAKIWRDAHAVLVVSEFLERQARSVGVSPKHIRVVRTGVDTELFSPIVSGEEIRSHYGLRDKRVIGFVGSLKPWHDIDTLLAAMRLLVADDPSYHLLVVGRGPRLDELAERNEPFVTLTGAVKHQDVPRHLAAMDVVAVPYSSAQDHYFSPIKLFESMAMGRPLVGARVGQVANVLEDGRTGFLYAPGDPRGLATAIERVFALDDHGAKLGAAARAEVGANYTWQHVAEQIVAAAEASLAGARA